MEFRGRLKVPGTPGEGIAVELRLTDVFLELGSDGEELGRWRLDEVEVARVAGDVFDLTLEDETFVFVAGDALAFAYEGLGYVEETRAKMKKRRRRRPTGQARALVELLSGEEEPEPAEPEQTGPGDTEPRDETARQGVGQTPAVEPSGPPAPRLEGGVPVVVEAPAVTFVDTLSTMLGEVPDDPLPPIGTSVPGPPTPPPAPEPPPVPSEAQDSPPPGAEGGRLDGEVVADESTAEGAANDQSGSMRRLLDRLGRKPDDHTHVYGDPSRTGAITRRVCEICGHVTFDSDRVYRDW